MGYKVDEIEGIGPVLGAKLNAAGIKTTEDFLTLCCDKAGRKAISAKTGIDEGKLLKWANLADLMRISGVARQYSELLEAAGVDTVKELRGRVPANLAAKMKEINEAKKLSKTTPSEKDVASWVEQAKKLEPKITH